VTRKIIVRAVLGENKGRGIKPKEKSEAEQVRFPQQRVGKNLGTRLGTEKVQRKDPEELKGGRTPTELRRERRGFLKNAKEHIEQGR